MAVDVKTVMDTVESYVADMRKAFPVHKVYLYGSYAKGTQAGTAMWMYVFS
jgi:predicted nucleotidyltransferase